MNNIIYIYIFAICAICNSCANKKEYKKIPELFGNRVQISGEKIQIEGFLGQPIQILAHDSLIFINEFRNDQLLYVYNAKSGELISRSANVGKGPNEFLPPIMISFDKSYDKLNIYDRSQSFYGEYKLSNSLGLELVGEKIRFNSGHSRVYKLDSTSFFSSGFFDKGRFCMYAKDEDTEIEMGEYPDLDIRVRGSDLSNDEIDNNIKEMIFQAKFGVRPDSHYFVACGILTGILEIYEIRGDTFIKKKEIRERDYVDLDDFSNGTIIKADIALSYPRGFSDVFVTQEYIYVLYSGRSQKEFPYRSHLGSSILVFDWQGNPIWRFDVDEELKCITLNYSSNTVYAINVGEKEAGVIFYDLNQYLSNSNPI